SVPPSGAGKGFGAGDASGGLTRGRSRNLDALLVALVPLVYVYMPRPPVAGSQYLVYPVMAGVLGLATMVLVRRGPAISIGIVLWLLLLLGYSISSGISLLFNASELRGSAPVELFRPIIFGIFLVYGYVVGRRTDGEAVNRGLLWAAMLIVAGQFVLAVAQLLDVTALGFLYE